MRDVIEDQVIPAFEALIVSTHLKKSQGGNMTHALLDVYPMLTKDTFLVFIPKSNKVDTFLIVIYANNKTHCFKYLSLPITSRHFPNRPPSNKTLS